MATATKPKLIIFDLDDTLLPAESTYDLALSEIGISPQDPSFLKARAQVKSLLPPLAPVARSRFLYLKCYLEMNHLYSAQSHLDLAEKYENLVVKKMQASWQNLKRPALFRNLKSHGFEIAILTNETCRLQTRKLASFESGEKFFDFLLSSEERGVEKPNLNLFKELLTRFQVNASQTLMVGDSLENDIQPALELKIPCLQTIEFKNSQTKLCPMIKSLDEVLDYIQ